MLPLSVEKSYMVETALAGLRVIEVGNFMAAPFCTMQLADLGADVVKIENPDGGDQVRTTGPFIDGESSNFIRLNRNKRSLALDLKAPAGKAVFRKLIQSADVLVENLRPGTMKDLELDWPRLSALNPRLVYVAASGWGQDGPYAQRPGLDIIAQGMSGLMSITGVEGGAAPVKIGVPMTDLACALYGAMGAMAALRVREKTGRGQFVDVCLFEAGVSFAVWEAGKFFATGEVPKPLGSAHQTSAPYQALKASDGFFTIGATSVPNWRALCKVLGLEGLENDSRFAKNHLRHQNRKELIPLIEAVTSRKPADHWVKALTEAGVPCGPLQTYDQVFNDPHLNERNFFQDAPHKKLGPVKQLGSPMRLSETPTQMRRAGPMLGEHTDEVLRELNIPEEEIRQLHGAGVVKKT
jgi:crotonobetainyl-CoA:carnitine CoA-transferase CaiB-like acyl-CoA transferase